jgi:hypothetical protein
MKKKGALPTMVFGVTLSAQIALKSALCQFLWFFANFLLDDFDQVFVFRFCQTVSLRVIASRIFQFYPFFQRKCTHTEG